MFVFHVSRALNVVNQILYWWRDHEGGTLARQQAPSPASFCKAGTRSHFTVLTPQLLQTENKIV